MNTPIQKIFLLGMSLLLLVGAVSAYPFTGFPQGYGYSGPQYSDYSQDQARQDVYHMQNMNRYITHVHNHNLVTVHHHQLRVIDVQQDVNTFSHQDVDVVDPTVYGGSIYAGSFGGYMPQFSYYGGFPFGRLW